MFGIEEANVLVPKDFSKFVPSFVNFLQTVVFSG